MFDSAFAYCRALASTLGDVSKQVLVSLRGLGDEQDYAETATDEPVYGVVGFISRPMDPDDDGAAEYIAARGDDNLTPFAGRDLRISKARGTVPKGTATMCTQTGAFVSIDNAPSGTGSVVTIYAPYQHTSGVPAKAHAITVDTTTNNEHIAVIHAAGHSMLLTHEGKLILKNSAGDAFISLDDDGITITGDVKCTNNVIVGSPATADKVMLADPTIDFVQAASVVLTKVATLANVLAPGTISPDELTALATAAGVFNTTPYLTRSRLMQAEPDVP